jgi:hypothetical protein
MRAGVWHPSCHIQPMNNREKANGNDKEWRRLCELVVTESNPERLSRLIDQLLEELDARRRALPEKER